MCKVKKISVEEVGSQVPNAALKNVCLIMGSFGIRDLKEGFCIYFFVLGRVLRHFCNVLL